MATKTRVGKRGEVVIRKPERELSGIGPGDEVLLVGRPGEVIVKKVPTLKEVLFKEKIASVTIKGFEKERRILRRQHLKA